MFVCTCFNEYMLKWLKQRAFHAITTTTLITTTTYQMKQDVDVCVCGVGVLCIPQRAKSLSNAMINPFLLNKVSLNQSRLAQTTACIWVRLCKDNVYAVSVTVPIYFTVIMKTLIQPSFYS